MAVQVMDCAVRFRVPDEIGLGDARRLFFASGAAIPIRMPCGQVTTLVEADVRPGWVMCPCGDPACVVLRVEIDPSLDRGMV
jgi:hypothetical protein